MARGCASQLRSASWAARSGGGPLRSAFRSAFFQLKFVSGTKRQAGSQVPGSSDASLKFEFALQHQHSVHSFPGVRESRKRLKAISTLHRQHPDPPHPSGPRTRALAALRALGCAVRGVRSVVRLPLCRRPPWNLRCWMLQKLGLRLLGASWGYVGWSLCPVCGSKCRSRK